MLNTWAEKTLGDLVEFQRGFDLPANDRVDGDIPVIAATGPVGTHVEAKVAGPGVVIGRSGSIGGGQFIRSSFWPLNTTLWVKDFKGNDPRFVYYLVQSIDFVRFNAGSGVPTLNRNHIHPLPVRFPKDIEEQRSIAAVLGSLDDKIEQNWRTGRALEALARATFKAWFVDFEPVKAKAAGQTSFPGMPPAAFAALPALLTDSPLGLVPHGWDTPVFSEIVKQSSERVGTASVPAYSSTNEGLRPRDEQFKKDLAKDFAKNLLIRSGDLVFGNSREILNFGVMYEPAGSVSQVYKVFRPQSEVVTPRYIEMMIRERSAFYRQIIRSTTRDNQGIMADFFLQLPLLVPPQEFRDAYAAVEKPVREMIDHLQAESAKLATLRDYLLPRLLSGRVRVKGRTS